MDAPPSSGYDVELCNVIHLDPFVLEIKSIRLRKPTFLCCYECTVKLQL